MADDQKGKPPLESETPFQKFERLAKALVSKSKAKNQKHMDETETFPSRDEFIQGL